ncbi:LysR substrate-binding domain-containing protein [Vibrio sp. TH_r3]|uniref:LysR substrate-binding domain-containing protein n=1 Tax=Vibrio sp. TH_r3 TaxID=3082084 RepID=UPI0029539DF4|nr:LysR substrate-binding domain-containing protein [Vibrio sp. TH_r3]MDV7103268.1 LysR substrate-binding domain-containing protein [Vibrio sp. TH_r3]
MVSSQDIEFFIVVAASPSLAAAARTLNVTPPSVSQRLQYIEAKLAVKLVERNARSISLTNEGEILARQGQQILTELESLQENISNKKIAISGHLRLLSPIGFGEKHIGPIAAEFQNQYPLTKIELNLSDIPQWSVHNSPDIMLYIGHLEDSSLKRIVLAKNRRFLLASPDYLSRAPLLDTPKDLGNHRCIALRENNEDATMWRFTQAPKGTEMNIRISPVLSSNVSQVTKDWCVAGQGIIQRSEWDVQEELENGQLVRVLSSYQLESADIVALLSSERLSRSRKVTVFLEFMQQRLAERLGY